MGLQLTAAEIAALLALDPHLDTAFAGGLVNGVNVLVPPLSGYTGLSPALQLLARQAFEIALVPLLRQPAWTEIGSGGGAPSFLNSWVNYNTGLDTAAFYVDAFGVCHLKGTVRSGTLGSPMFVLPTAPTLDRQYIVASGSGSGVGLLYIQSNGAVTAFSPASNSYVSLDGVSFRP